MKFRTLGFCLQNPTAIISACKLSKYVVCYHCYKHIMYLDNLLPLKSYEALLLCRACGGCMWVVYAIGKQFPWSDGIPPCLILGSVSLHLSADIACIHLVDNVLTRAAA